MDANIDFHASPIVLFETYVWIAMLCVAAVCVWRDHGRRKP